MERPSWCEYFMNIAQEVSKRATCDRKHVGAVIVSENKHILATGFNGSVTGTQHCDEVGHLIENNHCIRVVHAEANALIQAARNGVKVEGATIYINTYPCWECFKLIANANLSKIVYKDNYRNDEKVRNIADLLGIVIYPYPNC